MTKATSNQTPEQRARHAIDQQLIAAGWVIQDRDAIDFNAGRGIAVREYLTDVGEADYLLFVDRRPLAVLEAKPEDWGYRITVVEDQSGGYASARLKWFANTTPLPFVYESTGVITRFTDGRDPKPRSREVFSVHRPETLADWAAQSQSLRARLQSLPALMPDGLRDCQVRGITNLEISFKVAKPRALMQMATGSGKTFTAISAVYRLLKHADAKRILFLVDTRNLGEQAEQEFMAFVPNDDNRKLTELYNVQRLASSAIARESQVCICTIQRMYALLKDQPLDEAAEETNPAEQLVRGKQPLPVVYNPRIPPEEEGVRKKEKMVDLRVRTKDFALRVIRLYTSLPKTTEAQVIGESAGRKQLKELAYGAGKPGLNLDNIRSVKIPLPELDEQKVIVQKINELLSIEASLTSAIESEIQRAESLRQSILKKAFSGRLVPQDPNDEPTSVLLERIRAEQAKTPSPKRSRTKRPGVAE